MVYRALRPIGLFPPVIGRMEWWQVAVELDNDIGPRPPRIVVPTQPLDVTVPRGPRLSAVD